MSIAKVSEVIAISDKSFDDAVEKGIARASKTLKNITTATVTDHEVDIDDGKIVAYKVRLKIVFILKD